MKTVLPDLINEDQTGFVTGRYTGDSLKLLCDIMYYLKTRNLPALLVSIDFGEEFDSISWLYMQKAFRSFGFGNDVCRWISSFYTFIKSSLLVNGKVSTSFSMRRGCRQGDPICSFCVQKY